jgi:hypothetical protein
VQEVEDEHEIPDPVTEVDVSALQVHDVRVEGQAQAAPERLQRLDARPVAVDRADREAGPGEQQGVAAASARDVEGARPARGERHVGEQPRRRAGERGRAVLAGAGPAGHAARHVEDRGDPRLGERGRRPARAEAVLADDHHRAAVLGQDGGG